MIAFYQHSRPLAYWKVRTRKRSIGHSVCPSTVNVHEVVDWYREVTHKQKGTSPSFFLKMSFHSFCVWSSGLNWKCDVWLSGHLLTQFLVLDTTCLSLSFSIPTHFWSLWILCKWVSWISMLMAQQEIAHTHTHTIPSPEAHSPWSYQIKIKSSNC